MVHRNALIPGVTVNLHSQYSREVETSMAVV